MDFWSRLIGGTGTQGRQSSSNKPQQRLARFKRVYTHLIQTWQKAASFPLDKATTDTVRTCLQRLTTLIRDESRSPAPHLCLSFAASTQIYNAVAHIGFNARDEGVVKEAVHVLGALIDSEEDDFIANVSFAKALITFINQTLDSGSVGEDTHGEIIELLFGIAAKIRSQTEILPVWFKSSKEPGQGDKTSAQENGFVGITQKEDFPLCYLFIDHIHHDGRIGDFARTGLLYVFELTSRSAELEQWIVESDLPTLMASGLGALYSQLSRKLSILHPTIDMPVILALSDYSELQAPKGADSMFSHGFQTHMETFLSYLTFWQDVLEHCRSVDVTQTLIDHFHILFLQQLLYPSILQSSDIDGGSSVAVLTYLRHILLILENTELVHMIMQYLLGLPETSEAKRPVAPRSLSTARRRMSLMLLTQPTNEDDRLDPTLFSLVDLVLGSLRSQNPQTTIAGLKLIPTLLSKHFEYSLGSLLHASETRLADSQRTHGALNAELDAYITLAQQVGGEDDLDAAYENHLKDAFTLLESHPSSVRTLPSGELADLFESSTTTSTLANVRREATYFLRSDDSLLKSLVALLQTFLTNNVEINLGLTEAIVNLAASPNLRLEGWLAVEPSRYTFHDGDVGHSPKNPSEALYKIYQARRQPSWSLKHTPVLMKTLQDLKQQVELLRADLPNLDDLVVNRKQTFRLHEEIDQAMQLAALHPQAPRSIHNPLAVNSGPGTPQKPNALPQRMFDRSGPPSRSQSPRGRAQGRDMRNAQALSPTPSTRLKYRMVAASPTSPLRERSRALSPASGASIGATTLMDAPGRQSLEDVVEARNAEVLKRRFRFPLGAKNMSGNGMSQEDGASQAAVRLDDDAACGAERSSESNGKDRVVGGAQEASLNHILTNLVILQEFVLELAAITQVRATLFNEVRFA